MITRKFTLHAWVLAIAVTLLGQIVLAACNNTDHLHPNDAGYKAMADAVDLKIFAANK